MIKILFIRFKTILAQRRRERQEKILVVSFPLCVFAPLRENLFDNFPSAKSQLEQSGFKC